MDYTYEITALDKDHPNGAYIRIEYNTVGYPTFVLQRAIPIMDPVEFETNLPIFIAHQARQACQFWKRQDISAQQQQEYQDFIDALDVSGVQTNVVVPGTYDDTPVVYIQPVSMAQFRVALKRQDLIGTLSTALAALPLAEREELEIQWEYEPQIERSSAFAESIRNLLGATHPQLDALFVIAAGIQ